METTVRERTPWHLWAIGLLAVLWNGMGALDYTMTHLGGEEYMASAGMDAAAIAYVESFPAWAVASWALGVWGGLAGSILLLLRNRYAVWAFAVSLLGVIITWIYSLIEPYVGVMNSPAATAFEWAIKIVAIALLLYAWAMRKRGVLR